jgi:hypothetical protein
MAYQKYIYVNHAQCISAWFLKAFFYFRFPYFALYTDDEGKILDEAVEEDLQNGFD